MSEAQSKELRRPRGPGDRTMLNFDGTDPQAYMAGICDKIPRLERE